MEKEILENYLNEGMSIRQISAETGKSFTTIRYWIKKFDLKSKYREIKYSGNTDYRICPNCKKNCNIEDFYQRRGIPNSSTYCKKCTTIQTKKRMNKLKRLMVEYKGGCCIICGYDKYLGALEFHHLDPSKKDYSLSALRKYSFDDRIKKELNKCILVCSNCHREIHGKIVVPSGFEPEIEE